MHQKALVLRSRLGSLALIKLPIPTPDKDEVLVKIHSSALNPVDWNIQKKGLFIDYFPAVLGCDISGEIVKVGNQVTSYTVGDRVYVFAVHYRLGLSDGSTDFSKALSRIAMPVFSSTLWATRTL
jgi:NADPH:quinone reductase-like Zn-dependent oxidoreductase